MKTIVLTGGPCAGKTSALARIVQVFTNRGIAVYTLPEAATLFNQAGVNFLTDDRRLFLAAEKALLRFQMQLEDHFARIAATDPRPALLVCDRGTMDIASTPSNCATSVMTLSFISAPLPKVPKPSTPCPTT